MWQSDGMVRHVNLKTPFPARARFGGAPAERQLLQKFRRRLGERGVPSMEIPGHDGGTIVSCVLTVADALAVGYDEFRRDGLLVSLLTRFPELRDEEQGLQHRLQVLEGQFRQRRAG